MKSQTTAQSQDLRRRNSIARNMVKESQIQAVDMLEGARPRVQPITESQPFRGMIGRIIRTTSDQTFTITTSATTIINIMTGRSMKKTTARNITGMTVTRRGTEARIDPQSLNRGLDQSRRV